MPGIVLWKETAKYEKPNFAKAMVLMGKTRYYDENLLAETEQHSLVTKFFLQVFVKLNYILKENNHLRRTLIHLSVVKKASKDTSIHLASFSTYGVLRK